MGIFYILLFLNGFFLVAAFIAIFSTLKFRSTEKKFKKILQSSILHENDKHYANSIGKAKSGENDFFSYELSQEYNLSDLERIVNEELIKLDASEQKLLSRELGEKNKTIRSKYIRKLFDFDKMEQVEFIKSDNDKISNGMKFFQWILTQLGKKSFILGISILAMTIIIPSIAGLLWEGNIITNRVLLFAGLQLINYILQIAFIVLALLILLAYQKHYIKDIQKLCNNLSTVFQNHIFHVDPNKNLKLFAFNINSKNENVELAIDSHKAFINNLFLFWFFLFILYFLFLVKFFYDISGMDNFSMTMFFDIDVWKENNFTKWKTSESITFSCFKVFINNLSFIALFNGYIILHRNSRRYHKISTPIILLFSFSILFGFVQYFAMLKYGDNNEGLKELFLGISGLINAVLLSLLIGKLDSKIIEAPAMVVASLFLYAAIQPMFVFFFGKDLVTEVVVLYAVLILKILFFAFLIWVIKDNRLIKYLLFSIVVDESIQHDNEIIDSAFEKKANNE